MSVDVYAYFLSSISRATGLSLAVQEREFSRFFIVFFTIIFLI